MRKVLAAAVVVAMALGCDARNAYWVAVTLVGTDAMRNVFAVGDTAHFVATIYHRPLIPVEGEEQVRSRSNERPDLFEWSTGDSTVANLAEPGTVVMRRKGETTLRVKTASASAEYRLIVFQPK